MITYTSEILETLKIHRKSALIYSTFLFLSQKIHLYLMSYNEGHGILGSLLLSFQKVSM
jgi:hypothetical protein